MLRSLLFPKQSKSLLKNRIKIYKQFSTNENNILENEKDSSINYIKEHQIILQGLNTSEKYQPILSFDHLSFLPQIKTILSKEKFQSPTPIQAISWPVVLDKKDVISVAKTGSGKTLAFLLPAFNLILGNKTPTPSKASKYARQSPTVLVLAPTRELAQQTANEALKYTSLGINICTVFGGAGRESQVNALRKGANVVVATPGRCNDLAEDGALDLSKISYLVLDEADRMLDMGFEPQIRGIIDQLPKDTRQTLMFTATWPKEVQSLASDFLTNPVQINIGDQNTLNANKDITQHIMVMKEFEKFEKLMELLNTISLQSDNSKRNIPRTIVFVSRKNSCDDLVSELRSAGYTSTSLHGNKTQAVRNEALNAFRMGKIRILVATDVAARGLDVKDIQNVINFDFPASGVEDYVHRIGRTARGGSKGSAYTFLTPKDMTSNHSMLGLVGVLKRCEQIVPHELSNITANNSEQNKYSYESRYKRNGTTNKYGESSRNNSYGNRNNYGNNSNSSYGNNNGRRRLFNSDNFEDFNSLPRRTTRSASNRRGEYDYFD